LNHFEFWIKTTQQNKRIAAAWMHQHVSILMIGFNFIKIIISYIWMHT
jgi:hypothetical protein